MTDKNNAGVDPGKQVANIEEQLRKQLAGLKERVGAPPSNKISTKGKIFTLPDDKKGNELNVVVLDWRWALAHYPGVYNPNNPQDPDCFAIGVHKPESGQLLPHPSIEKPHGSDCNSCPKNQWKTAATGNGKACKNQIRLLVASAADIADPDVKPLTLYISPKGLKGWNAYVSELASVHGLDVMQVVTNISFDPNEAYPMLVFKSGQNGIPEKHAHLAAAFALKQRYQEVVERPIEFRNAEKKKAA